MDTGIGAPLPPSTPSIWDPNALFSFPSGKPELLGVPVPGKGAGSPPASTHPQEQQQQQARPVHGAAGSTCPHHPPPAAALGFQFSPLSGQTRLRCAALRSSVRPADLAEARLPLDASGRCWEKPVRRPRLLPAQPAQPPEPRPPSPQSPGGESRERRAYGETLPRVPALKAYPPPRPATRRPGRAIARPSRKLWARVVPTAAPLGCGPSHGSLSCPSSPASGFSFFPGAPLPTQLLSAIMPTARPPFISWSIPHPSLCPSGGFSLCRGLGEGEGRGSRWPDTDHTQRGRSRWRHHLNSQKVGLRGSQVCTHTKRNTHTPKLTYICAYAFTYAHTILTQSCRPVHSTPACAPPHIHTHRPCAHDIQTYVLTYTFTHTCVCVQSPPRKPSHV